MASASHKTKAPAATNNSTAKKNLTLLRLEAADGPSLPKNPFMILKSVEQVAGKIDSGFPEHRGARYALRVTNAKQVKSLLRMDKLLDGTPVTVRKHPGFNVSRCVIDVPEFDEFTEEMITQELASQGLISARRITIKNGDNSKQDTSTVVLTFAGQIPPKQVKFYNLFSVKTRPYYPNLIQCFKCWQFWHTKPDCSCDPICGTCSGPHESVKGETCPAKPYCKKCKSDRHPISSRKCPEYIAESVIWQTKIDRNITYHEAKQLIEGATAKSVEKLTKKITDMEQELAKKDNEIGVLRGIFATIRKNRKMEEKKQKENSIEQRATCAKEEAPSKDIKGADAAASVAKPKQKQNSTLSENQQGSADVVAEEPKNDGQPTGRSGKKRRGKGKKK